MPRGAARLVCAPSALWRTGIPAARAPRPDLVEFFMSRRIALSRLVSTLAASLVASAGALASDAGGTPAGSASPRPRVGLVLAGGGAKAART